MIDDVASLLGSFDVPDVSPDIPDGPPVRDIFAVNKRKAWDKSLQARCDFSPCHRLTHRGVWFFSIWKKSLTGRTLVDIKSDPTQIARFSAAVSDFIVDVIGNALDVGAWAICSSPKRRHKVNNFAANVATNIAGRLNIPFYEDVALCRSKQRINAVFDLNVLPKEPNIIVFDDFVTTGSTLNAMDNLLKPLGKNVLFFAGINNDL